MIRIQTLNAEQLDQFAKSPEYDRFGEKHGFVPISRHRACSHIHNPRAEKEDVLLLIAYNDDLAVGYLGVLPDTAFKGKEAIRCGWMSCIWIDERQRGKGIARILVEAGDAAWGHKILGTDFAQASGNLFDKMGIFDELRVKKGIRLYVRSELHKILPPRNMFFSRIKPVLKGFDTVANLLFDLRFLFIKRKTFYREIIKAPDDEAKAFIEGYSKNELFRRGIAELEWITQYPWILAGDEDADTRKYHFSSVDRSFNTYPVKLRDADGSLIAYLYFTKRDRQLKLPYCYMVPGAEAEVAACIEDYLVRWRIHTFSCFHPRLVAVFEQQPTIALFKKNIERRYVITRELKRQLSGFEDGFIQDGDADAAFT